MAPPGLAFCPGPTVMEGLLSHTPTEPSIQDSRLVHSTQASLWRAKEANTEPLARSGRCPAGEPSGRSSSLHRGGGPQEPKGHPWNIRQHQGRLAGAVRTGLGLSCQSYRLPLQLVEKELNGEARHTPPTTSVCESKAPCLLELHCFSATGTFWLLGTPIGQQTSESKKESFLELELKSVYYSNKS